MYIYMKTQSIFKRNLNSLLLLIFLIFFISINSVSAIDDKFSITIKDNDTGLNLSVFNAVIENDA